MDWRPRGEAPAWLSLAGPFVSPASETRVLSWGSISNSRGIPVLSSDNLGLVERILGHSRGIVSLATNFTGSVLVSGDGEGTVRAWDFERKFLKKECVNSSGPVWSVAICPTRREVAFARSDGFLQIWNLQEDLQRASIETGSRRVLLIRYRADGQTLIWVGEDGKVYQIPETLRGHPEEVYSSQIRVKVAHSDKNGQWLAIGGYLNNILVLNSQDNTTPQDLPGHRGGVCSLDFHPNGKLLASGGRDCMIRLWDLDRSKEVLVLSDHRETVLSLCFSLDGTKIASGDAAGNVCVWDCEKGRKLTQFELPRSSSADAVAFGPRSESVAAGGTASELHICDLSIAIEAQAR